MVELTTGIEETGTRTAELCRQFLAVATKKLTGTLVVTSTGGETKSFLCQNGTLADIDTGREMTLLSEILLGLPDLPPRVTKKAQKIAEKSGCSIGAAIMELQPVPEEGLLRAIEEGITDEVTEVFDWAVAESVFHSHGIDESIEGFVSDLSDFFDLLADPETLFLEAAQRLGRWDLVRECYDLLRDVFYATPGTFGYFREPETYPAEIRILAAIDGIKDVEEVIEESALDPFAAIEVVRYLIRDSAIELINPVQLFQLATQADSEGNLEKACRLYQRAMERGLDDFDVEFRLGQVLERIGRRTQAAACFFEFSSKCLVQLRIDDAIRSLERVVKLSPGNTEAVIRLVDLCMQHNRTEEALEAAMAHAHRIGTESRTALDILLRLRSANLRDVRLHDKIIELATEVGDQDLVREERELIAQAFHDRRDAADALEAYQRMFCEGQDTLEVRLKLIELHKEQGNRQKAIEHINFLLNLGGRRRVSEVGQLLFLHETMRELQPADVRSNRFLADYHLTQGEKERAIEVLEAWLPELERTGDLPELASALEWLINLDDRLAWRWSLAQILERQGKQEAARAEFQKLAHRAMHRREFEQAAKALEHLLRRAPLDVETRRMQAELLELREEKETAADRIKELALLEIIAGNIQEAEGYCRQYLLSRPDDAEIIDKFGRLCLESGDRRKAIEQFLKAAKAHLENRNLGLARSVLDRLFKVEAQNLEAEALVERLESLVSAMSRAPARSAAAVVATAAAESSPPSSPAAKEETATAAGSPSPALRSGSVKASISGITARLRDLKTDGMRSRTRTVPALGDAAQRLRATTAAAPAGSELPLKPHAAAGGGGGEGGGPRDSAPSSVAGASAPAESAARSLESGADGGAQGASAARSKSAARDESAAGALKSAAARLKALSAKHHSAKGSAPSDDAAPPAAASGASGPGHTAAGPSAGASALTTEGSERREDARAGPEGEGDEPGAAPPTARIQARLGASANRLAALRKALP